MDKDKIFDPARHNEKAPEPGFASVNTHNPGEEEQAEPLAGNQVPAQAPDKEEDQETA